MQPLCRLDDLVAGQPRGFRVGRHSVIVLRTAGGRVCAYLNRCPHLGIPLNWADDDFMDSDGKLLRCATHGALFDPASGQCLLGPCKDEFLWQLDCHINDGQVEVDSSELPGSTTF
jgi:nitrite reductase/ring-hydroxylating ferredoxin subunit